MDSFYTDLVYTLDQKPNQLDDMTAFLFCVVNLSKAMIDNTDKSRFQELNVFLTYNTTQEIKLQFDFFQGMFGQKAFSQRKNPNYLYLCSLIAHFPEKELGEVDKRFLEQSIAYPNYLLYDLR